MPDPRDTLELRGTPVLIAAASHPQSAGPATRSPFLRLWFRCANQYARATKSPDGTAYLGRCPTCGATARFPIGPGGCTARSFEVSCR